MTLPEPSDTVYEMALIYGLTFRLKDRIGDDAFLMRDGLFDHLCCDVRNMHDDSWQLVTSRKLRCFMDFLLERNWILHCHGGWDDWPPLAVRKWRLPADLVAYEYVTDWHNGQNAERLAFFEAVEDPDLQAPILCARKSLRIDGWTSLRAYVREPVIAIED